MFEVGPVANKDFPSSMEGMFLTKGTLIRTDKGELPVENLCSGDLIETRDNGFEVLRQVDSLTVSSATLANDRRFWPVRVPARSMGYGLPERDLLLAPQARALFSHIRLALMFGEPAVFVRAKSLCASVTGISVEAVDGITYYQLKFDRHEVIYADGLEVESHRPDDVVENESFMTVRSWELMAAIA